MSVSLVHTFLEAYEPYGDLGMTLFWQSDGFVGRNVVPPWYNGYVANGHSVLSLGKRAVSKIQEFAQRFWALSSVQEKEALIKHPGDDREGLEHSRKYIAACVAKWKVNTIIDDYVDIKEVYRVNDTTELPTLEDAQVFNKSDDLAYTIFGMVALYDLDPRMIKPPFLHFLKRMMALRWNTYRKQRKADINMVAKLEEQRRFIIYELVSVGAKDLELKRKVSLWMRRTMALVTKLCDFHDVENAIKLAALHGRLESLILSRSGEPENAEGV